MKTKNLLLGAVALSLSIQVASAKLLNKVEVKIPYQLISCDKIGVDSMSSLGLRLNKLSASETDENIEFESVGVLNLCRFSLNDSGEKALSWVTVNPFKGYKVQYFDFSTDSIKSKFDFIDSNKSFNRLEMILSDEESRLLSSANTYQNLNDSFIGRVSIEKKSLLNQFDHDLLKSGKTVSKKVSLSFISNMTTIAGENEIQSGDQVRSGQNIILTFKKVNNKIRLLKIN